ncbi:MAG: S1 RNA-binding domain-containing protein, partial [Pirellulaceae bacterium]|nr:S1 RNA-binding domain-containing protein [Pirellulaceae bacterium]
MVDRNLIRTLEDEDISQLVLDMFPDDEIDYENWLPDELDTQAYEINKIIEGKIISVQDDIVLVDVGYKSEGTLSRSEWKETQDPPEVGQTVQVLIQDLEDDQGMADDPHGQIAISKEKADIILHWQNVISNVTEGDIVTGTCTRKIKGGLLVDIGVPVFLPASQVDIRRPGDIADFIGRVVQCEVLKIDEQRRNIVVSRRSLIEKER